MGDVWQPFDRQGRRKYLTADEQLAVFVAAAQAPMRDGALAMMLLLTGCRLSEALALRLVHIDRACQHVVFRTLKRREVRFRCVPVPRAIHTGVWNRMWQAGLTPAAPLWPWSRTTAWRRMKRLLRSAGIEAGPHASPKGLRHGFAVSAITGGVPLVQVKKWLGHASLRSTECYLDATGPEERALARHFWAQLGGGFEMEG